MSLRERLIALGCMAAFLAVALSALVLVLAAPRPFHLHEPRFERKSCGETPTLGVTAFDKSQASDVLYAFVYDNVFRKDLARGFALATPHLRSGLSRQEWLGGSIPVPYEPVSVGCSVGVTSQHGILIAVMLVNGTYYRADLLHSEDGWLVDYFLPASGGYTVPKL